ncbi:MAG: hypothetical protein HKO64_05235, partial [Xanthomonadales bacterium]|nr:hypothetical protein [Xanthomonadales bacterium]
MMRCLFVSLLGACFFLFGAQVGAHEDGSDPYDERGLAKGQWVRPALTRAAQAIALDELHINPGLNDAWVSDGAPFQGLFITIYPELELVFVAWFTFDSQPVTGVAAFGAADQRWATAVGSYSGTRIELVLELTTGGHFNTAEPLAQQNHAYGTMVLDFQDCSSATVTYDVPSAALSGMFEVHRAVDSNIALC